MCPELCQAPCSPAVRNTAGAGAQGTQSPRRSNTLFRAGEKERKIATGKKCIVFPAQGVSQPQIPKHFGEHWQEGLEKRNLLSAHARPLCSVRSGGGVGLTAMCRRLQASPVSRFWGEKNLVRSRSISLCHQRQHDVTTSFFLALILCAVEGDPGVLIAGQRIYSSFPVY